MGKKRAAHVLFQRVQRAVHADTAQPERFGGTGDIPFLHEGHEDAEFAECNLARGIETHNPPGVLVGLQHRFQLFLRVQPRHFARFEARFGLCLRLQAIRQLRFTALIVQAAVA